MSCFATLPGIRRVKLSFVLLSRYCFIFSFPQRALLVIFKKKYLSGGQWKEVFNSDAENFWGTGIINYDAVTSETVNWHGREDSITVTVPPLGASVFRRVK